MTTTVVIGGSFAGMTAALEIKRKGKQPNISFFAFTATPKPKTEELFGRLIDGKIKDELGWVPQESFETGIRQTVEWYLSHLDWCRRVQDGSYQRERLGVDQS